jgi:hypothetical protein
MSPSSASPPGRPRRRPSRPSRWLHGAFNGLPGWVLPLTGVAVGLLGLLSVAGLSGARNDLSAARSALEAARSAMTSHDVEPGRVALERAGVALGRAGDRAGRFPLVLLRPVPLLGSPVKALAAGVTAGNEATAAGRILNEAAEAFPTSGTGAGVDGHNLSAFHAAALKSSEALDAAGMHLAAARTALQGPAGAFLPPVSSPAISLLKTVDGASKQLHSAARGLRLLSSLTSAETDVRLLLLSQDSMELRPTGGFIGSFGVFHFDHGQVELERYENSVGGLALPEPPMDAPDDLENVMGRPWDLSNSNWWPDFPTSAATAVEMFRRQGGGEVAGVVAVTEHVMARLVGAVGPVTLPSYSKPVVEEGFAERVLYEVEIKRPQDNPRKKFLTELADEVFHRLFALPADKLPVVAETLGHAAAAGDLQIYFANPAWQADVAGSVLEGALPKAAPGEDFLLLSETNMTAGKANAELVRNVTYGVRKGSGGRLVAALEIEYRNNGVETEVNPYYNGLLRVYVPRGSELTEESLGDSEDAPDGPYTMISSQVYVPPEGREVISFTYRLPKSVPTKGLYRLSWLRQPGTPADSLTATVGNRTFEADPAERRYEVTARL